MLKFKKALDSLKKGKLYCVVNSDTFFDYIQIKTKDKKIIIMKFSKENGNFIDMIETDMTDVL